MPNCTAHKIKKMSDLDMKQISKHHRTARDHADQKKYRKAIRSFELAQKEDGYRNASYNIGVCHARLGDYSNAKYYYELASASGSVSAKTALGDLYYQGKGVEQNYHKAYEFYRIASYAGHNRAIYNLSHCYKSGTGVAQDSSLADKLLELSKRKGYKNPKTPARGGSFRNGKTPPPLGQSTSIFSTSLTEQVLPEEGQNILATTIANK